MKSARSAREIRGMTDRVPPLAPKTTILILPNEVLGASRFDYVFHHHLVLPIRTFVDIHHRLRVWRFSGFDLNQRVAGDELLGLCEWPIWFLLPRLFCLHRHVEWGFGESTSPRAD
jgi:hypothetical protein